VVPNLARLLRPTSARAQQNRTINKRIFNVERFRFAYFLMYDVFRVFYFVFH